MLLGKLYRVDIRIEYKMYVRCIEERNEVSRKVTVSEHEGRNRVYCIDVWCIGRKEEEVSRYSVCV